MRRSRLRRADARIPFRQSAAELGSR